MNATTSTSSITHLPARRARQAGWNLIELMVVVSIITILLAILINTAVEGKGPIEQTKVILRGLNAVATEYEVATTLKIDHLTPATLATSPVTNTPSSIHRFCFAVWKLDKTRLMMSSLGKDAVAPTLNNVAPLQVNDAWGKAIRYYSGSGTTVHIEGGTSSTLLAAGMPSSKDPYFASAGPDGKWGTVDANNVPNTDARDNLYSNSLD